MKELDLRQAKLESKIKSQNQETDAKLEERYKLSERFNLLKIQTSLLKLYLTGYLIVQDNTEFADFLRTPDAETLSKFPILNTIIGSMQNKENVKAQVSKSFFGEASKVALQIRSVVEENLYIEISKNWGESIEKVKVKVPEDNPIFSAQVDSWIKLLGSPGRIRNAANLITSTYVKTKDKSKEEQDVAMEATLSSIKIREPQIGLLQEEQVETS